MLHRAACTARVAVFARGPGTARPALGRSVSGPSVLGGCSDSQGCSKWRKRLSSVRATVGRLSTVTCICGARDTAAGVKPVGQFQAGATSSPAPKKWCGLRGLSTEATSGACHCLPTPIY